MFARLVESEAFRRVSMLCSLALLAAFWSYEQNIAAHGPYGTMVFTTYWASGHALVTGANPYSVLPETYTGYIGNHLVADLNLNPPLFLPVARLFALFPVAQAALVWQLLSTLVFIGAIAFVAKKGAVPPVKLAWAFLLPVFSNSIELGQNYIFLFVPAVAAWWFVREDRLDRAAVALGFIVAFKPNFAALLAILFVAGHMRLAIRSGLAAAVFTALPALFYGPAIYLAWAAALRGDFHGTLPAAISLVSYFQRLNLPLVGYLAAVAAGLAALLFAFKMRPPLPAALTIGSLVAMLCSPLAWYHYTMVLVPGLMTRRWDRLTAAGAILLLVPTGLVGKALLGAPAVTATLGGVYPLAALLILAGAVRQAGRPTTGADQMRAGLAVT